MSFTIFNVLIFIGCVQGLLLSYLLVRGVKFKRKSNSYLALFIFSFSLNNLYYFAFDIGFFEQYPIIYFLPFTWGLLMPFAFYYFVEFLLTPHFKQSHKTSFWMALPFGLHVVFQLASFVTYLVSLPFLARHIRLYNSISHITELFNMLFALVVLVWVLMKINRYHAKLKDNFSSIENRTLAWLRNLIVALFFLWGLWCVPYVYEFLFSRPTQASHYPLWIGMSIIIYWIGYSAYTKGEVFEETLFIEPKKNEAKLSEKTDEHYQKLKEAMSTHKPYLNPELNLETLAADVKLSAGYLSQIINKKEKVNFYDFVNRYRVEEAKKIIINPKFGHYSLLAIGQEAGFNSKSTFNAAFKKYAGVTPSEYKKQLLNPD